MHFHYRCAVSCSALLVVASRPDEHYSSEERALFARVSHEVGAALFALRAQASELMLHEVRAVARPAKNGPVPARLCY